MKYFVQAFPVFWQNRPFPYVFNVLTKILVLPAELDIEKTGFRGDFTRQGLLH